MPRRRETEPWYEASGPRRLLLIESIEPEGAAFALIEQDRCKSRDRRHQQKTDIDRLRAQGTEDGEAAGARAWRLSAYHGIVWPESDMPKGISQKRLMIFLADTNAFHELLIELEASTVLRNEPLLQPLATARDKPRHKVAHPYINRSRVRAHH